MITVNLGFIDIDVYVKDPDGEDPMIYMNVVNEDGKKKVEVTDLLPWEVVERVLDEASEKESGYKIIDCERD